jgi:hypothetical protein
MRGFATKPLTTSKFVQKELKENPEFFKAFPNLQRVFDPNPKKPNQEINRVMTKEDTPNKLYEYQNDRQVKWVDVEMKAPYFNSLLHKHNQYSHPIDSKEEIIRDNEINFIEGPSANVEGPFKYLDR